MKTVLCYGDSLTWGYSAEGPGRHAYGDRWTSVLQADLGDKAHVIPEGLNGRTTAFDDWVAGADRNGARILPTLLSTHGPVDLVILMLGTNDMKPFICGRAVGAKQGMERLVNIVRGHDHPLGAPAPAIVLVSPPPLCETQNADFAALFDGGIAQSQKLAPLYRELAQRTDCTFFEAGAVARTTPVDGVHLDVTNTRAIGAGLAPIVREVLDL